ncbi:MAG: thiol-disulfide oxidoreductase DCC family protein [Planctomycetaceae bacterium]
MDTDPRVAVLYDDDCGFCRWAAERLRTWGRGRALRFATIQGAEGERLLAPVPSAARLDSMHAVTPDGRVWSAGAAVPVILRALPAGRPFASLARLAPGLTDRAYRTVAARRARLGALLGREACAVDPSAGRTTP